MSLDFFRAEKLFAPAINERSARFFSLAEWRPRLLVAALSIPLYFYLFMTHKDIGCGIVTHYQYFNALIGNFFFSEGHPLWNPYVFGGQQGSFFTTVSYMYPLHWFYFLWPADMAWSIQFWIHLLLTGQFVYLLARQIGLRTESSAGAALLLCLGGFFPAQLYDGSITYAIYPFTWFPLALMLLDRGLKHRRVGDIVLCGVAMGMTHLAGLHQHLLTILSAAALYTILSHHAPWKSLSKKIACVGLFTTVAFVVGAAVFLPTLFNLADYNRLGLYDFNAAIEGLLPKSNLAQLAFPFYAGDEGRYSIMIYAGALALPLTLAGLPRLLAERHLRALLIIGVLPLLFCASASLFWVFFSYVPGFSLFLYPMRYLYIYILVMALLVPASVEYLLSIDPISNMARIWQKLVFWGIACFSALLVGALLFLKFAPGMVMAGFRYYVENVTLKRAVHGDWSNLDEKLNSLYRDISGLWDIFQPAPGLSLLSLLAGLLLFYFYRTGKIRAAAVVCGVVLLCLAEFVYFGVRMGGYTQERFSARFLETFKTNEMADAMLRDKEPFRYYPLDVPPPLAHNEPMRHKLESVGGDGVIDKRYAAFVAPLGRWALEIFYFNKTDAPQLALLNVRYLISKSPLENASWELVEKNSKGYLYRYRNAMPRAALFYNYVVEADWTKSIDRLESGAVDYRNTLTLEKEPTLKPTPPLNGASGTAEFKRRSPDSFLVNVDTPTNALLFVSEKYFRGWRATVDGKNVDIMPADVLFRAVEVPAGKHVVEFHYAPWEQYAGFVITLLCLLSAIVLVIYQHRRLREIPTQSHRDSAARYFQE